MKNDKTKNMIVAALAVVVLGIGAFQFIGKPAAPPAAPAKPASAATTAPIEVALKNPAYAGDLPVRDPFASPMALLMAKANPQPTGPTAKPLTQPLTGSLGGPSGQSVPPLPVPGSVPGDSNLGSVPVQGTNQSFAYHLSGIIAGDHPAAVFTDAQGNQRLVSIGGSLDGDSQLVQLGTDGAYVKFRGHRVFLTLGDAPNGK